jgi:hypothetical protein
MKKAVKKLRLLGMFFSIIKALYEKLIAKWRTTESTSAEVMNETGMPTFPTLIQYNLEFLTKPIGQDQEIKAIQTGKEEVKLTLFADDMTLLAK